MTATAGRVAVSAGVLLVILLLVEGLLSLAADRSLAELLGRRPSAQPQPATWRGPDDDDLIAAAARNPGLYKAHEDPLVGFVLKADAELTIYDVPLHTDRLGMRQRPDGPPPQDAQRIVVLGDSVAFGFGVRDEETLAHQLEVLLREHRAADARPVAVITVAVPGWNHRNAVQFYLDHYDVLGGDVVLYMPIGNDLANTFGVLETGHRADVPDIATPDPWLRVSVDRAQAFIIALAQRLAASGATLDPLDLGPPSLNGDVSAESSRRYDENAASIRRLAGFLEERDVPLMLLQYVGDDYIWHLWGRLAREGLDVPVLPLLGGDGPTPKDFTLGHDPHPSAETLGVLALWCAEELLSRGWIDDAELVLPLPATPADYAAHRAPREEPSTWAARADALRERRIAALRPVIDVPAGRGVYQIYGGLNPDGSARRHLLATLPRDGASLRIAVAPIAGRPDLYPLRVHVEVDGQPVGALEIEAGAPDSTTFPLPVTGPVFEVRLKAERAVVTWFKRRSQMAAYELHEIAVE